MKPALLFVGGCLLIPLHLQAQSEQRPLVLKILSGDAHAPVACRVHLKNAQGQPVFPEGLPRWRDHFVCPGSVQMGLAPGRYSYQVERGPEYVRSTGSFELSAQSNHVIQLELKRSANLANEGWWSGELHVHRPLKDIELLMQAEDVHVCPVITWWNNQNQWTNREPPKERLVQFDADRYYNIMGGEDEREGGALLFFGLEQPLAIAGSSREYPSPMKFLNEARQHSGVWIDIEKPFWWDVPIWLASGKVDSIGLANNHMCRDQMYESEAWGKPRDTRRLPAPLGNGFWSQEIYYHILNCGLRIPPSAGSASGVLPNPVGYNRVYVHLGKNFSYESWWEGLRAGRSFVSNGPLLRCRANGELPGHIFKGAAHKDLSVNITADLSSQDPVSAVEIIKNGKVERVLSGLDQKNNANLGKLNFDKSGWFLVRVLADNPKTFRFASTAPFYVEVGNRKGVSETSARFFLDWVRERMKRVKLADAKEQREVLTYHEMAEKFWENVVSQANMP